MERTLGFYSTIEIHYYTMIKRCTYRSNRIPAICLANSNLLTYGQYRIVGGSLAISPHREKYVAVAGDSAFALNSKFGIPYRNKFLL